MRAVASGLICSALLVTLACGDAPDPVPAPAAERAVAPALSPVAVTRAPVPTPLRVFVRQDFRRGAQQLQEQQPSHRRFTRDVFGYPDAWLAPSERPPEYEGGPPESR